MIFIQMRKITLQKCLLYDIYIYIHVVTVGYSDIGLHKGSEDPHKRVIQYNISMVMSGNVVSINYLVPLLNCQRRVGYVWHCLR